MRPTSRAGEEVTGEFSVTLVDTSTVMADAPEPRTFWQKCSVCKKPIAFGGQYLKCVVSTCNRKRFQLFFCSGECWDAHNPDQNHRNPGYTEHIAPEA